MRAGDAQNAKLREEARTRIAKATSGYTVCDGHLVLHLEPAEEGGYVVTAPLDPELVTQGETLEECFEMARDAIELLRQCRHELIARVAKSESNISTGRG